MNFSAPAMIRDCRHALRNLWREKAFTSKVLSMFALCAGANAFSFCVVHSILVAPFMESLLFNVSPGSPGIFIATAAALASVVPVASLLPSRRAASVSAMESLRGE
jgi:ABC-type antimicrobial peptide transport system permease subunit